jgi:hypothetical protein
MNVKLSSDKVLRHLIDRMVEPPLEDGTSEEFIGSLDELPDGMVDRFPEDVPDEQVGTEALLSSEMDAHKSESEKGDGGDIHIDVSTEESDHWFDKWRDDGTPDESPEVRSHKAQSWWPAGRASSEKDTEHVCEMCKEKFKGSLNAKLCDMCRSPKYRRMARDYAIAHGTYEKPSKKTYINCELCGELFRPLRSTARYCSAECRKAAWLEHQTATQER